jgi:hypothetical protein
LCVLVSADMTLSSRQSAVAAPPAAVAPRGVGGLHQATPAATFAASFAFL